MPVALAQEVDLLVEKSGPAQAPAGTNVMFTITLVNAGPDTAESVTLSDPIPAGMTFVMETHDPAFTCNAPLPGSGGTITCAAPELAPNVPVQFTFTMHIPSGTPPGTTFVNIATGSTETLDVNDENNSGVAPVSTPPPPTADMLVLKQGPSTAGPGTNVVYTISVGNNGPDPAANAVLTDTLPGTLTFVSLQQNSGPMMNCTTPAMGTGGTITCSLASFPAGATATFTLTAQVPPGTGSGVAFTNTATVSADNDPTEENDVATTTFTVSAVDVSVVKSGPATVTAGTNASYILTVGNSGPDSASNVVLSDPLPAGTTFVSLTHNSGPAGTCTTNGTIVCQFLALPSGQTAQYTLVLRAGNVASISNTATVGSDEFDTDTSDNTSTAVTTVTPSADLRAAKSAPATVVAGTNLTYDVSVANDGPTAASNVSLVDTLPAGTTFVSATQTSGPAFACSHASGTITCTIATFAPAASASFQFVVNVPLTAIGSTLQNSATVSATTGDPNGANNTATTNTTVAAPVADLRVTKSAPPTATPGTNLTFAVSVTNAGPDTATSVSLADVLPANVTFVSATQTSGPAFTCNHAAGTITCTIAALAPAATATFDFVGAIAPAATGTLQNTATVTAVTADPDGTNNAATTNTTTAPSADVAVTKSAPATAAAGTNVTFNVSVANNGPSTAASVTLSDTLPSNVTFVAATQTSGPAFTCGHAAGTITCTVASLAPAATATFDFVAAIAPGATGSLQNTAAVSSPTPDPNGGNNTAATTTTIAPSADLGVTKSAPASAVAGTNITFNVSVANNGPSTATNVSLVDTLPPGVTFLSVTQTSGPTFLCNQASGTITCTIASFAPAATATFDFTGTIAPGAAGSLQNTATVSSAAADPNAANNSASTNTSISSSADVRVAKLAPPVRTQGTSFPYHLTVANDGPSTAANVTLVDTLPSEVTFVSTEQTSGPPFTCNHASGTVTCTIASLAPGASATFLINVTVALNATGPLRNTATVSSATADPNGANNSSTATTVVARAPVDLTIQKTADRGPHVPNGQVTYTIVVTNNGPGIANAVTVTDELPAGTTLRAASPGCTGTSTVVCTVGTLGPGASATLTLQITLPPAPGPYANTATVSSDLAGTRASTVTVIASVVTGIPTLSPFALVLLAAALGALLVWRSNG